MIQLKIKKNYFGFKKLNKNIPAVIRGVSLISSSNLSFELYLTKIFLFGFSTELVDSSYKSFLYNPFSSIFLPLKSDFIKRFVRF